MTEPAAVDVTLTADEVSRAAAEVHAPAQSMHWLYLVAVTIGFVTAYHVGPILSFMLSQYLPMSTMVAAHPILSLVLSLTIMLFFIKWSNAGYMRLAQRRQRRELADRGMPSELPVRYEVLVDGLRLTTARSEHLIRWHSISELAQVSAGWFVVSDIVGYFVPRIAFADAEVEKAFAAALLARMDEAARARSTAARDFAVFA